ncbi:MAG TPA: TIGR02391 family protein [Gaiellaceae bacterium]|nr:TIGR02391 family protein [Gaiellaceae bacterium]
MALWKKRARTIVGDNFGDDYVEILNNALRFGFVISSEGQARQMDQKAMDDAATFLRELQAEEAPVEVLDPMAMPVALRLDELHPAIREACSELYEAGHPAEAVEKSFKVVRSRLRQLTGHETGSEAFDRGKLRIKGAIEPWVEDDFNEGVKFLTMAIDKFRNEKAHTVDAHIDERERAAEYLAMSSLAMRLLEGGYIAP